MMVSGTCFVRKGVTGAASSGAGISSGISSSMERRKLRARDSNLDTPDLVPSSQTHKLTWYIFQHFFYNLHHAERDNDRR